MAWFMYPLITSTYPSTRYSQSSKADTLQAAGIMSFSTGAMGGRCVAAWMSWPGSAGERLGSVGYFTPLCPM